MNTITGFSSLMSSIFTMPVIYGFTAIMIGGSIFLMVRMSRRDYAASGGSHRGTKASAIVTTPKPAESESTQVYSWADIVAQSDQDSGTEEDDGESQEALERTTGTGRPADVSGSMGGPRAIRTDES